MEILLREFIDFYVAECQGVAASLSLRSRLITPTISAVHREAIGGAGRRRTPAITG